MSPRLVKDLVSKNKPGIGQMALLVVEVLAAQACRSEFDSSAFTKEKEKQAVVA